jgi:ATP-dependent protease ClpP protease subunit
MSDMLLYGVVGEEINALSTVRGIQAMAGKKLMVRLNTPGGSVWDGNCIAEAIREHGNIHTHIDALAASMGSTMFLAGSYRTTSQRARFMMHNPASFVFGDAKTMRKEASVLEGIEVDFAKMYADASGGRITREEAQQLMDEETWLTPEELVAIGFAHAITGNTTAFAPIPVTMQFKNTPKGMYTMSTENEKPKASFASTLMARFTTDVSAIKAELEEASVALSDASMQIVNAEARATAAEARASEAVAALASAQEAHAVALAEAVAAAKIEGAQEFAAHNLKASAPDPVPHVEEEDLETFTTHTAKEKALRESGRLQEAAAYYATHKKEIFAGE